jgi:hypothetical protein
MKMLAKGGPLDLASFNQEVSSDEDNQEPLIDS